MYTDRFTPRESITGAVLAGGFVLAWSSGFIGATLGTRDAEALTLLMWRFVIVAPLLVAWSSRRPRQRLTPRELALQSVIGLLSQGVYLLGVVLAVEYGIAAGTVALIAATQPILAAALARPVLGERVARSQWLGLVVGLAGVAVVVAADLEGAGAAPAWTYALPFAAVAGLTAATLLERRVLPTAPIGQGLAVQCAGSAILFAVLAVADGAAAPPADLTFWVAVAWTIGLSTIGGYGLYWINAARIGATRVSSLVYLTPPTTALWGLAMFGQPIGPGTVIGMLVCLVGVLLARPRGGTGADAGRDLGRCGSLKEA